MAPGIWPWRNGFDFAMIACRARMRRVRVRMGSRLRKVVKKRANSTEAA